jgi:Domain of unknown function (DUF4333)
MFDRLHVLSAAVLAATLGLLTGCGTETVTGGQLEQSLTPKVQQQTGAKNARVQCPPKVEAKTGVKARCTASAPGEGTLNLVVTMRDDNGNYVVQSEATKRRPPQKKRGQRSSDR